MDLGIDIDHSGARHTVLAVHGEIDTYSAPQLRHSLSEQIVEGRRQIVIDMTQVSFLDSAGLGVLIGALRRLRSLGGDLTLAGCARPTLKLLRITGLDSVFRLSGSGPHRRMSTRSPPADNRTRADRRCLSKRRPVRPRRA